jgi:hypothetical protein
MKIAYDLLMPLPEVLQGLPGVYPLKLASHLRALLAAAEQGPPALPNVLMLSQKDLLAMFAREESKRHIRATPFGVKKLIELYEQETLPLRPGVVEWRPAPQLFDYIASEKELLAETSQKHLQSERVIELLSNPGSITEADFSYDLLHALFARQPLPENSVLSVGNIQVTRCASSMQKNRRGASPRLIIFRWRDSSGMWRQLSP